MKPPKQKLPKSEKQKKIKVQRLRTPKPPKQKKVKIPKAKPQKIPDSGSSTVKNIIIAALVVALLAQSAALIVLKLKTPSDAPGQSVPVQAPVTLNVDLSAAGTSVLEAVADTAIDAIGEIKDGVMPYIDLPSILRGLVYSDDIISTVMSMSYPLLKTVLTDLNMMDFAENVSLYPTPARLAPLFENTVYSCCDSAGERKPLAEVLTAGGDDWSYMDNKVTVTDNKGTSVEKTLWNTIAWGVTDKASFYTAMNDMSEGIRGVVEICLQSKEKTVNINLVDFLLKIDKVNIGLDAARIYNASPKSGYELCVIPLFNILGLRDGEYRAPAEFCAYTVLGDMWQAILEPVLYAVDKVMNDPVQGLCDMLVNFADAIDSGSLVSGMKSLRMDAEFHKLAQSFMGFQDGLLFNLGQSLAEMIGSLGLDLSGSFNGLLDSLLQKILKNPSADMPDMDVAALKACCTQTTLPNGNTVWQANSAGVIEYLIGYAVQGRTVELVLSQTPLAGTPEAVRVTEAVEKSREGLTELVDVVLDLALSKIQ